MKKFYLFLMTILVSTLSAFAVNTIPAGRYAIKATVTAETSVIPEAFTKYVGEYVTNATLEGNEDSLVISENAEDGLFDGFKIEGDAVVYNQSKTIVLGGKIFNVRGIDGSETGTLVIKATENGYTMDGAAIWYNGQKVATVTNVTITEYVHPITVALLAEDETEYALNSHSIVTVDVPVKGIVVEGLQVKPIDEVTYAIYDKRNVLAEGTLSIKGKAYAEFDNVVKLYEGIQYNVVLTLNGETTLFDGYVIGAMEEEPVELAVTLVAEDETEYALNSHSIVTVDVPVKGIVVEGLQVNPIDTVTYAIYDKRNVVAEGILSINNKAYAEFDNVVSLYEGIQYNVVLTLNGETTLFDSYVIGAAEPEVEKVPVKVDFSQFDGVDATGADPIKANEGVFAFVGNNSKATLTKSGFYTGGNSSATARYIIVTPEYDGTLTVEGTASGDNTDRYIFVAEAPGADESAAISEDAKVAIPEKGVRHSLTTELKAGNTYYICMHGNGTITALSYEEPTATSIFNATAAVKTVNVKTIENGKLVIVKNGVKYNAAGVQVK